jgi:UTP-glucose-1-phosphate uridylyltransferase
MLVDRQTRLGLGDRRLIAFEFEGKRYDVGDKLGFLQATVEFALKREDLNQEFTQYLIQLLLNNKDANPVYQEIVASLSKVD